VCGKLRFVEKRQPHFAIYRREAVVSEELSSPA